MELLGTMCLNDLLRELWFHSQGSYCSDGTWVIKHRPLGRRHTESLGLGGGESTSYLPAPPTTIQWSSTKPIFQWLFPLQTRFFLKWNLKHNVFEVLWVGFRRRCFQSLHHQLAPDRCRDRWISWWDKEPLRFPGIMSWKIVVAAWLKEGDTSGYLFLMEKRKECE